MNPPLSSSRSGSPPTLWRARLAAAELRFSGRRSRLPRRRQIEELAGPERAAAWADQVHSARVLSARPGNCGPGDALVTLEPGLALAIAVADCVPVAIAAADRLAVVHAGWRGIVAGVVPAALERLADDSDPLCAWIGPAIGPCCYEVEQSVASAVAAASSERSVRAGSGSRPHLDLAAAVASQLHRHGIDTVTHLELCTRCHPRQLWSYRGQQERAGRNLLVAWLRE